jgi:hypothetical protein
LQVAPGFLRMLYGWRYRHISKLKTQS